MSNWTNEPDGDGWYWIRKDESDTSPTIAVVDRGCYYHVGDINEHYIFTEWQWQKVKPYEQ